MFIIFINKKINVIKFDILNESIYKLIMIYNNIKINKKINIIKFDILN